MTKGIVAKIWNIKDGSKGRGAGAQISDSIDYITNSEKCDETLGNSQAQIGRELSYVTNDVKTLEAVSYTHLDFEVLNYALNNGWKPYIRFDLHAKTYIVDDKRMITSSANATGSGLGLGRNENLEMGSLEEIEADDLDKIRGIYRDAIMVDVYKRQVSPLQISFVWKAE